MQEAVAQPSPEAEAIDPDASQDPAIDDAADDEATGVEKSSAVKRWYEAKKLGFPTLRGNGVPRYGMTTDSPPVSASRLVTCAVRGMRDEGMTLKQCRTLVDVLDAMILYEGKFSIPYLKVRRDREPNYIQIIDEHGKPKTTHIICEKDKEPEDHPGALMQFWLKREEVLQDAMGRFSWQDVDVGHILNRLLLDYEPGEGTAVVTYEAWTKKVLAVEHLREKFDGVRAGDLGPEASREYCRHKTAQFIRSQSEDNENRRKTSLATADGHIDVLQQAMDRFFSRFQVRSIKFEREKMPKTTRAWLTPDQLTRLLWATLGLQWDTDANGWKHEWRVNDEGERKCFVLLDKKSRRKSLRMMRRFLLVYLLTGTRYDVILKLRWGKIDGAPCIDAENGKIYRAGDGEEVPGQKPREESPIIPMLLPYLRRWEKADRGISDWVIHQGEGSNYAGGSVWRPLQRLANNAGLPSFTAHVSKHSGATFLNKNGLTLRTLSIFFGTSAVNTERVYSHVDEFVHQAAVQDAEKAGLVKLSSLSPNLPRSLEARAGSES